MLAIISEPERWTQKNLGRCYNSYNKIFTVQADTVEEIEGWAAKYSKLDHMRSRGNCGETKWKIQKIGGLYAVHFVYEIDSGD